MLPVGIWPTALTQAVTKVTGLREGKTSERTRRKRERLTLTERKKNRKPKEGAQEIERITQTEDRKRTIEGARDKIG